jgi:hypothetical protein
VDPTPFKLVSAAVSTVTGNTIDVKLNVPPPDTVKLTDESSAIDVRLSEPRS